MLGVSNVIVCGHSGCGAIGFLCDFKPIDGLDNITEWLTDARQYVLTLDASSLGRDNVARLKAKKQIDNLMTYPIVQKKLGEKRLEMHAWFFDVKKGELQEYDSQADKWTSLVSFSQSQSEEIVAKLTPQSSEGRQEETAHPTQEADLPELGPFEGYLRCRESQTIMINPTEHACGDNQNFRLPVIVNVNKSFTVLFTFHPNSCDCVVRSLSAAIFSLYSQTKTLKVSALFS